MGVKLRQRAGKGWYVFIDWNNQRKAKFFGQNKKLAKEFADKLAARVKWAEQSGEPLTLLQPNKVMPTVKEYLTDWLDSYVKLHCKKSTYHGYKRAVKKLVVAFGECSLPLLKREDVKRLIAKLVRDGKARGTIQNCLVPLKAAYNQA